MLYEVITANDILPALRRHLDRNGFSMVQIAPSRDPAMAATRLAPDHPWVQWAVDSIARFAEVQLECPLV